MSHLARRGTISGTRRTVQVTDPDADFKPISYSSVAAARTAMGAPSDANYVVWNHDGQSLEQVFASLGANDILVLPERAQPYPINSSNGFMASGIASITGAGPDGDDPANRTPIVSNGRLWFSMSRARRGVLGMGPGAVIQPTNSGWTAPEQPKPLYSYNSAGTRLQELVGSQNKLMEVDHDDGFFANFTLKGRDFGGVTYHGLSFGSGKDGTIRRIHFDESWRGTGGIPNIETGALTFLSNSYIIENCLFTCNELAASSPIMWNRTLGGTMRMVKTTKPTVGMITFWKCGGVNTFENVYSTGLKIGVNLEENIAGFTLNWTGGYLRLTDGQAGFHLNINPSGGSEVIRFTNVEVSPNGYTANAMSAHVYTTTGTQKRSDVSWSNGTVSYVPSVNWIA